MIPRSRWLVAVILIVGSSMATGCSSPRGPDSVQFDGVAHDPAGRSDFERFFARRFGDLLDSGALRFGAGPGLLVHARITQFLAIGAGGLGPQQPWRSGFRVEVHWVGSSGREGGVWTERRAELGISTFYYAESEGHTMRGDLERYGAELRRPYDVGFELFFGLLGVAMDLDPLEWGDFVAGWFGLDPSGDDVERPFTSAAGEP